MKIKQYAVKKTALLVAGFFMMTLADLNSIPVSAIGALAEDNDVIVEDATDDPAITFFVHGLGGHASDWSNTFSTNGTVRYFEKDPDSLIEKMRNTTSPAMNLYRINTSGYTPTDMDDNYLDYSYAGVYEEYERTNKVSGGESGIKFSEHTLIVLEYSSWSPMPNIYTKISSAIDDTLIAYKKAHGGKKARINLIGHSLGGLVNMRYTINHKNTVANLISLGTPYNGSWYDNDLLYLFGVDDFKKQGCINGTCGHPDCNIETRRTAWNNYHSNYPDTNFYALSGETSWFLLAKLLHSNDVAVGATIASYCLWPVLLGLSVEGSALGIRMPGDICADVDSQKATGYAGVSNYNKLFNAANCDIQRRSENFPAVPHNLEAYDSEFHTFILEILVYAKQRTHESYNRQGISVEIFTKINDNWIIKLTNNTDADRCFEYDSRLCNSWDADDWSFLEDIESTDLIRRGQSIFISVTPNVLADTFTIAYQNNESYRNIFYGEVVEESLTMKNVGDNIIYCPLYHGDSGMQISNLSHNNDKSTFLLINNTGNDQVFYYTGEVVRNPSDNSSEEHLGKTKTLKNGESAVISTTYKYNNTSNINVFYIDGDTKHVLRCQKESIYSKKMSSCVEQEVSYKRVYNENGITISCIGRGKDCYVFEVINNTGKDRTFEFNASNTQKNYALSWVKLNDVNGVKINDGASAILTINCEELSAQGCLAISYTDNNFRYVTAATTEIYGTSCTCETNKLNEQIKVEIEKMKSDTWYLNVTNCTGSERVFYYNKNTCWSSDARDWDDLVDIDYFTLANNSTKSIQIKKNGSDSIAISYISGSTRYIFYATNLNEDSKTMDRYRTTKSVYSYDDSTGLNVKIVGKDNDTWLIDLKNTSNSGTKNIEYSSYMCTDSNALSWSGFKSTPSKISLSAGKQTSDPIRIKENGTKGYIAISYFLGNYRYIFYANLLNSSGFMYPHFYSLCEIDGMVVENKGRSGDIYTMKLTNNTGSSRFFYYNTKTCFINDAKSWNGLNDIAKTKVLSQGESIELKITKNGPAETIAISYVNISSSTGTEKKGNRYIFYADYINESGGSMTTHKNTVPYHSYTYNSVEFSILTKYGSEWLIEVTNYRSDSIRLDYNSKMCFWDDAYYWEDLFDIKSTDLISNGSTITIKVATNGTSDTICASWINGSYRYVFYAQFPNASTFEMTPLHASKALKFYTCDYGFKVNIVGKNGSTWLIDITNTRSVRTEFIYNSKTCFEGDAKDWSGLKDEKSISLDAGKKTTKPIEITKNGAAETIAISFINGTVRYIFYAYGLDEDGAISNPKQNSFDTTQQSSSNCITEGTLITLADGTQKKVEDLTGDEMLLVWNMETGTYDAAPILFIDKDPKAKYDVIELTFSDGTTVNVVSEHGFFDTTLNKYVYLDKDASQYIGHTFVKQDKNGKTKEVELTKVKITNKTTTTYSPVTYGSLCYYVSGMLSMPGGISGLFNYFDVDPTTMAYDKETMAADIEKYGLFTYEEVNEFAPISREMFDAVNGQYLKIAIGKGLLTPEYIQALADRYSVFIPGDEDVSPELAEEENKYTEKYVLNLLSENRNELIDTINKCMQSYTGKRWVRMSYADYETIKFDVQFEGDNCYVNASLVWGGKPYVLRLNVNVK